MNNQRPELGHENNIEMVEVAGINENDLKSAYNSGGAYNSNNQVNEQAPTDKAEQFPSKYSKEFADENGQQKKKWLLAIFIIGFILGIIIVVVAVVIGTSEEVSSTPCTDTFLSLVVDQETEKNTCKPCGEYEWQDPADPKKCIASECQKETEIMTADRTCQKCEEKQMPSPSGHTCKNLVNKCKPYEFLNHESVCEECPRSYMQVVDKCQQIDRPKIDMINVFEKIPMFAHYNMGHPTTQGLSQFFDEKFDKFRGVITQPFTIGGRPIDSPILHLLFQTPVTGKLVKVKEIQEDEDNKNYFMDVWFISTQESEEENTSLRNLEIQDGPKCCWNSKTPQKNLSQHFTGMGRIIKYADFMNKGTIPEYAYEMFEGQIVKGEYNGFGRRIEGYVDGIMKFGYFKDSQHYRTVKGEATKEIQEEPKEAQFYQDLVTKLIKDQQIMVFSKSHCQYSRKLKKLLDTNMLNGQYGVYEIDKEPNGKEVQEAIKIVSGNNWDTVPALFISGEIIGGDDEAEALAKNGELVKVLDKLGLKSTFS